MFATVDDCPVRGVYADMIGILRQSSELATIIKLINKVVSRSPSTHLVNSPRHIRSHIFRYWR